MNILLKTDGFDSFLFKIFLEHKSVESICGLLFLNFIGSM